MPDPTPDPETPTGGAVRPLDRPTPTPAGTETPNPPAGRHAGTERLRLDDLAKLWEAKTTDGPGDCIIWTGKVDGPWRVPYMRYERRKYPARRVALAIESGEWPTYSVSASCATERCVAPLHLVKNQVSNQLKELRRNRPLRPVEDRFWGKVAKGSAGECWPWKGKITTSGYGQISLGRRDEGAIYVHRLSYQLAHGPVPDGLSVLHRCDNPPCVNPDHLFVGTISDNASDMMTKRRHPRQRRYKKPEVELSEHRHTANSITDDTLDHLYARLAHAEATVAGYEQRLAWHTTCTGCARVLDSAYAETRRAEDAEAERDQLRARLDRAQQAFPIVTHPYQGAGYAAPCTATGYGNTCGANAYDHSTEDTP